jgi:hypothetical protein
MSDRFTKDKMTWLDQVFRDRSISQIGFKIAYAIAQHMNRQKLWAWPTYETLSNEVRADRRSAIRNVDMLERRGHLTISRARGRHPNRYRWLIGDGQPPQGDGVNGDSGVTVEADPNGDSGVTVETPNGDICHHPTVTFDASNSDTTTPQNTLKNTLRNPLRDATPKKGGRTKKTRTSLPSTFCLAQQQLDDAQRIAGWNAKRAASEFERFKDNHRAKANVFADWPAAWRNWCRNGAEFDQRNPTKNALNGSMELPDEQQRRR